MAPKVEGASGRVRAAAFLVTAALVAGPVGTHVYWMLGGTWGLHSSTTMGIRAVAAVVVMLLLAAVMVVLARVGLWQQAFASDRVIRLLAWALAGFFLTHALVSFAEGWAGSLDEWWLYGPSGLVIGLLALVVAGSGGAWPIHRLHRTLPSHRRHRDEGPGVTAASASIRSPLPRSYADGSGSQVGLHDRAAAGQSASRRPNQDRPGVVGRPDRQMRSTP